MHSLLVGRELWVPGAPYRYIKPRSAVRVRGLLVLADATSLNSILDLPAVPGFRKLCIQASVTD